MASEFLLLYSWLNFFFLFSKKREEIKEEIKLVETKAIDIFEYRKNNDGYWNGVKLYKQVANKTLSIMLTLYSRYSFLFLFNNATSHSIYSKDTL